MEITYNGVTATSRGAIVLSVSPPVRAARRISAVTVPGRDGVLHIDDKSLAPIVKIIRLGLKTLEHLDEVHAWLASSGVLVPDTEPGVFYRVYQSTEIAWERIGRTLYQVEVRMDCEPYRYVFPAAADITPTSGSTITNPGTAPSDPKITIEGSGNVTLTVGGAVINLTGLATGIVLDSATQQAYLGAVNMSGNVAGAFPRLAPGNNSIAWTGTVTKVTVEPRWRLA